MKPIFSPQLLKTLTGVLILLLLVKLLWFMAELTLFPPEGIDHTEEKLAKPLYYRIKLTPNEAPAPIRKPKPKVVGSIKDITLLAVYNSPRQTVVTVRYKGKSKVLGRGESINGFTLEGAGSNYAIFSKGGKEYKVSLLKPKHTGGITAKKPAAAPHASPKKNQEPEGEIIDAGDHKIVDKSLLEHYAKNMDDIYKNIGIKEVKKGDRIEGFRITFVKRGSPFAKLGVKRGDVIKSINGQELTSYKAAFDAYKNIDDIQNITLGIQRGNKEMELEYEIN
jgi:general secretion pathway protein C